LFSPRLDPITLNEQRLTLVPLCLAYYFPKFYKNTKAKRETT
jgi:hypothetical protein